MSTFFKRIIGQKSEDAMSDLQEPSAKFAKCLCLFDVDGTLTKARQRVTPDMEQFLEELKDRVQVGLVGGSDLAKIAEQMGGKGDNLSQSCLNIAQKYHCVFAENGLVAYRNGKLQAKDSILNLMGEDKLQKFINFCLKYMSELVLPCKRGNFIEFRTGLINVCPVGRSVSQNEREEFALFDEKHQIRTNFVAALNREFPPEFGLNFVIGGQISIDAFPRGWDKTYCLKYLTEFEKIYFFGDKTSQGGNDFELYCDSRTIGYAVTSPEHTKQIVSQIFF